MTTQIRGSDVYLVADLERILQSLLVASTVQRSYGVIHSEDFAMGYSTAIASVAVAVGVQLDSKLVQGVVTP
jgi:hypothetical protein